jgi:hypothetical protein
VQDVEQQPGGWCRLRAENLAEDVDEQGLAVGVRAA